MELIPSPHFKPEQQAILQSPLLRALVWKNLAEFEQLLTQNVHDPQQIVPHFNKSTFHICFALRSRGDFIRMCLRWGCDPNQVNASFGKSAINFAVEPDDPDHLDALLEYPITDIDHAVDSWTPLHHLIIQLNDHNFDRIFESIRRLVDHQADVNIANAEDISPILSLANSRSLSDDRKLKVIRYMLDYAFVDLDDEARKTTAEKYTDLPLPPPVVDREWDVDRLFLAIRRDNEDLLCTGLLMFRRTKTENELAKIFSYDRTGPRLLTMAIFGRMNRAVELLLRAGAGIFDYSTPYNENEFVPIETACFTRQEDILQMLLNFRGLDVNRSPALCNLIEHIAKLNPKLATFNDFNRCFDLLLNAKDIDLNARDRNGNTALHSSFKYNHKPLIVKLLQRGAFIGAKNDMLQTVIEDIDPIFLEAHLDHCINTGDQRPGDDNYELIFDYANFDPAKCQSVQHDELEPIEYLAKSKDHKHLVKHPLIASFIYLKWHRFVPLLYLNFVCFLIMCLAIIPYIHLYYGSTQPSTGRSVLFVLSVLGTLYLVAREAFQFVMSPNRYLQHFENYLETAMIGMSMLVLSGVQFEDKFQRMFAAITILLVFGELFILTGSLPIMAFTTYLVMLQTVLKTFLRSMMLYSILLVGFALAFYNMSAKEPEDETDTELDFNAFSNPYIALVKTVVMMTGEIDSSSIRFEKMVWSYVMFLVFVLLSVVLFNLLNGLAISDTQMIKSEAELAHFIYRLELLSNYDKMSLRRGHPCFNVLFDKLANINLFPKYLPCQRIVVLPNKANKIQIPGYAYKDHVELGYLDRLRRGISMERKIVQLAGEVVKRKTKGEEEGDVLMKRVIRIEQLLDLIATKMKLDAYC